MKNKSGYQGDAQWIVAQRLLSHLHDLVAIKSSANDLSMTIFEIVNDLGRLCRRLRTICYSENLFLSIHTVNGKKHRLFSMDSDLEAFSRNPTDGSFAVLTFQLAAFTNYLNGVFLSY